MGVQVQTRLRTTYTTAMTDVQTTIDFAAAPANTVGYITVRRGFDDQEDMKYTGLSGLQGTGLLRGLSPTALTDTEVIALKKTHVLNSPSTNNTVEGTTLHYIINNKPNKDDNETITGSWNFTGSLITFSNSPKVPGLKDSNGNLSLELNPVLSAVNYLRLNNAATGNVVSLELRGSDTNIIGEFIAKGTGYFILPDKSRLKTNAAPINQQDIANKKYVDDAIAAAISGDASTTQKGVVEEATDAEVAAGTVAGGTGARLFINPGSTTVSVRAANKVVVTNSSNKIDSNIYDPDRTYHPLEIAFGESLSANDLVYQDPTDMKWKKITSTGSTHYHALGIVIDAGVLNDTGKRVLQKGRVSGLTFNNINPTFTVSGTGTDNSVGEGDANRVRAFSIDNTSGAECTITGGTISVKQQGTPSGALNIYLVLPQQEQANTPALYWDETNDVPRGAIIASASIAQALFSGTYQNLAFSFGSVKIPAGTTVYLCLSKAGNIDAANYYQAQASGLTLVLNSATQTWSGSVLAGNRTLTVTSTSPVGYAVKAYAGSNGSYGLTPSNPWARVIGHVLSSTEMYFDPERKRESIDYGGYYHLGTNQAGLMTATTNFCPSQLHISVGCYNNAIISVGRHLKGKIRGDTTNSSSFRIRGVGSGSDSSTFGGVAAGGGYSEVDLSTNASAAANLPSQNKLYAVRLENGYYLYNGYPAGANFLSVGAAGWGYTAYAFEVESKM